MKNCIEISKLSFAYNESKPALNNLDLNIQEGSYTVILGRNGSGKSTLAKLLLGLLSADSGTIKVNGLELNDKNIYLIRDNIGIVFQNPDNQFIGATVADDIAFGLENHCVESSSMQAIIDEFAKKVGMDKYLDKEPNHLSGGQKQRVAIAGVLAMKPSILIFDEATSMLDPKGKKEIKDLIFKTKQINKDLTIISITHDIEEVANATSIVILNHGEVYIHDSVENVFKDYNTVLQLGLDAPINYRLVHKLDENGIHIEANSLKELEDKLCQ